MDTPYSWKLELERMANQLSSFDCKVGVSKVNKTNVLKEDFLNLLTLLEAINTPY